MLCFLMAFLLEAPLSNAMQEAKSFPVNKHYIKEIIKGRVVDHNKRPLPGVNVKIADTQIGTTTDKDGVFSMDVKPGDILIISFIGFKTITHKIERISNGLQFTMEEDAFGLQDVVVVGFGKQKKVNLTGAVTAVSLDDLESRPITNASMALAGKVAGMQVTQNSGQPGADAGTLTIRGIGTLNNSAPLVIIDGFEASFNDVDPKDIAAISVLKDAASASIYGNKAANGVILITTKRGRPGALKLKYDAYAAVQSVTRYPDLLNSYQYLTLMNEAKVNSGFQPQYEDTYISHYKNITDPVRYRDYNWADFYFKPALQQNHYMQMSGGKDNIVYSMSAGYLNQSGIVDGTHSNKYNFRFNTQNSFLKNKARIGLTVAGYATNNTDLINGAESTISRITQMAPTVIPRIEGYGWTDWFYSDAIKDAGGGEKMDYTNFNSILNLSLNLTDRLNFEGAINYVINNDRQLSYAPNVDLYLVTRAADGTSIIGKNNSRESYIRKSSNRYGTISSWANLNYTYNYKQKHHFKALTGFQQFQWRGNYFQSEIKRLSANLPFFSVGDPGSVKNNDWGSMETSLGFFGRINYDYDGKYLFEANIRYDGASKFAKDHKWGAFPSFSAGWRLSQEQFFKGVDFIQDLKIRASWGKLGNQNIGNSYAGQDILGLGGSQTNYIFNNLDNVGAAISVIANKDLSWEETEQTNIGLDLQFLKDFSLTADYYIKKTNKILLQLPISSTFGFTDVPYQNAGKMSNKGIEIALGYIKNVNDWQFKANLIAAHNTNRVLDLKGLNPIIFDGAILKEGVNSTALYGYDTEGIYQSEGEIQKHLKTFDQDGFTLINAYAGLRALPGDVRFKDQNGDGIIDDKDKVVLGHTSPDYVFSANLNVKYKAFDLTTFFEGTYGGRGWSAGQLVTPFFNGGYNGASWLMDRWTAESPNNTYQRVYFDNQRGNLKSKYFVEDLSYLRLKNIELAYNFSEQWLSKISVKGLRLFVSGQNLFTITGYKGFDPEASGNPRAGSRIGNYPQVKTYTAGLNLNF
ncbi:TonB-linked outer membrane protein, SusC/RagA family [Pedobacter sp. ok626]|nr:TonB-linked outer membrane protein, SusC/RagA family [Pedobacter sp. ok626]